MAPKIKLSIHDFHENLFYSNSSCLIFFTHQSVKINVLFLEMTLLRRPVAREVIKRKSPISDEKGDHHGDDLSELTDNSSLALKKTMPYHSRIPKSDKYNRSKCNPTPVTNGADDDLFEEINTGPDPFPFRPPRQDRINQLMAFYQQYLETNYQKGRSFCLEDFLLENGVGIERELDESLKRSSDDREVSRQNYLLSYQRNDFVGELTKETSKEIQENQKCHAKEITEILKQPNLNRVDLNKLVDIDLVPRKTVYLIRYCLFRLNLKHNPIFDLSYLH